MNNPETSLWRSSLHHDLLAHYQSMKGTSLRELFHKDPRRFEKFSFQVDGDMLVDVSKCHITEETLRLLLQFAEKAGILHARDRMFQGESINWTEKKPALHVACRNESGVWGQPDGAVVRLEPAGKASEVSAQLRRVKDLSSRLRLGCLKGATGKAIKAVVNIGIGGSHLGPHFVTDALTYYWKGTPRDPRPAPEIRFVSNVDRTSFEEGTRGLRAEETLFVISSQSFTTQETLTNWETARNWLKAAIGSEGLQKHFLAVTAYPERAIAKGITPENIYRTWEWVGGRYSCWSSVGLPIACAVGFEGFSQFLEGARRLDEHFLTTPLRHNVPVILAVIGVWYTNFFGTETHAILPYDQYLSRLPLYLQQLEMESNGKRIGRGGRPVPYQTCPIVWGEVGTNAQHSFFQLLHQGTRLVPADFIACVQPLYAAGDHHLKLIANLLAQTEALMKGRTEEETRSELERRGLTEAELSELLPHLTFPGNRPSTTILLDRLTPYCLGKLIALYEHKVFCQGILWGINSFDQFGVRLGKELAEGIINDVKKLKAAPEGPVPGDHDSSTAGLLRYFVSRTRAAETKEREEKANAD